MWTLLLTLASASVALLNGQDNLLSTPAFRDSEFCKVTCTSKKFTTCGQMDSRFRGIYRKLSADKPPESWVPDQSCTQCPSPAAPEFRSLALKMARNTTIQFQNKANQFVHLYWQSFEGKPKKVATVPPGGVQGIFTHEGHAFRIWDEEHQEVLLDFTAGRFALHNEEYAITYDEAAFLDDFEDPDFTRDDNPINWKTVRRVGFVNRAGLNMDLYYKPQDAARNETMISQLRSGGSHYELTYPNHVFSARIHAEGQPLLAEITIGAISIPDCSARRRCQCAGLTFADPIQLGNQAYVNYTSAPDIARDRAADLIFSVTAFGKIASL